MIIRVMHDLNNFGSELFPFFCVRVACKFVHCAAWHKHCAAWHDLAVAVVVRPEDSTFQDPINQASNMITTF